MDYATFTRTTAQRAGIPEETAERIEHATLRTLADRISGGEPHDLAAQLRPRSRTTCVLTTVREAVTPVEFDDVLSQLPQEYRELVGPMA